MCPLAPLYIPNSKLLDLYEQIYQPFLIVRLVFQDEKKKYFKRGDLIEKEREEYLEKYGESSSQNSQYHSRINGDLENSSKEYDQATQVLPRAEVIRRLRERMEPILLFGESELDAFKRLRQSEISEPEVNRGFRNDFQEAMDEVDQAYLDEILKTGTNTGDGSDKQKSDELLLEEAITYDDIQEMAKRLGRGNKEHDMMVITTLLQFLLKQWNDQLNSYSQAVKMSTRTKLAKATYTQTRVYLKPLLRKLKNKKIPDDILESLTDIVRHLLKRDYIMASDAYLQMAIGNAPWPIGVTMVGIHARTGREKIFSKNVAHVMNDETQRKYIQALKRLMTKCQEYFPTDPSRCVEYVSKKDLAMYGRI